MIVKIQVPLSTTDPVPKALIYDRTRTVTSLMPLSGDLMGKMRGRPKAFFHAEYEPKSKTFVIQREAEWQGW